jgi:hypothetical protein
LVDAEIRRLVAQAIGDGTSLSASAAAAYILVIYPRCGFDKKELADRVMMSTASANVPVEIGPSPRDEMADVLAPHKVVASAQNAKRRAGIGRG